MIHCPTCDAGLRFEVESQKMACDHCGNRFSVDQVSRDERHDAKGREAFDLFVFVCPDCGAELAVNDENDAVGFCPYCGGASMLFDRVRHDWVPDGIIPFKMTKEQCKQAYVDEVRKHPFVSKKYRDAELIDSFRGIYMPYWQFVGKQVQPFKVSGVDKLSAGEGKTLVRTYEQWYEPDYTISGLSHDASSSFDDHISERLAPYHDRSLEPFHPAYLSGFYAEIGDMDQETYEQYAKERCQDYAASRMPFTMASVERRSIETEVSSLKNVLYPVWFMSYRRGNKISYAAVNGETGKVAADLPLSPYRIIGASLALAAVLLVLFNLVMAFLPSIRAIDVLKLCAVLSFASACLLAESCLGTIGQSLVLDSQEGSEGRSDEVPKHARPARLSEEGSAPSVPIRQNLELAVGVCIAAFLGTFFIAIDGSYAGFLRNLGFYTCLASYVFMMYWAIKQMILEGRCKNAVRASAASQLENGIAEAYAEYRGRFLVVKAVVLASSVIAFILGLSGNLGKLACYGLCAVLAVEVLAYAATQISFQTRIAERQPPQMAKRGAYYDAN